MPTSTATGSGVIYPPTGTGANTIGPNSITNTTGITQSQVITTSTTTTIAVPTGSVGVWLEANLTGGTWTYAGNTMGLIGWSFINQTAGNVVIVTSAITGSIVVTFV